MVIIFLVFTLVLPLSHSKVNASPNLPPNITGEAAYLIDVQSGQTLFSKNGDKLMNPASTTKILTGLLAIEHGDLDEMVTASDTMLNYKVCYGTRIYLEPGEQLTLKDMLYALLLNSANDAAIAIAEHIGQGDMDNFTYLMNQKVRELGLKNSTFKNPSGLTEEGHLTTAHDLARIAQAAYANPTFREFIVTKSQVIPRDKEDVPIEMFNENKLLWRDPTITGMKTGYTSAAGNCLVASASRDGRDLIGVILKSPGKAMYTDMQALLDYGFEQFSTKAYHKAGETLHQIQVHDETVNLIVEEDIFITEKSDNSLSKPTIKILPFSEEFTEVKAGQIITHLDIWEGDEKLTSVPLVADRSVEAPFLEDEKTSLGLVFGLSLIFSGGILFGVANQKKHNARRKERARIKRNRPPIR
ncbi:MAG: D-alanyl-D-alanine carboxypeptidase [Desulfitobacterium sp.]|nr:D-alanyl-D-alanine carboxypeptidase [Desulfitobacterium sp.]